MKTHISSIQLIIWTGLVSVGPVLSRAGVGNVWTKKIHSSLRYSIILPGLNITMLSEMSASLKQVSKLLAKTEENMFYMSALGQIAPKLSWSNTRHKVSFGHVTLMLVQTVVSLGLCGGKNINHLRKL